MSVTIWRCECGAKYEISEAGLGGKVRCSHCGAVSRVEKPPSSIAPPPLPKIRVPSVEGSGNRSIAQGNFAAAVNRESKKPEIFQTVIWVAGILGTGTLLLLLSVLLWVFRGSSTPQQQAENAQPSSVAKEMDNPRESLPIPDGSEGKGETDRPFPTPKELPKQAGTKNPPAVVQTNLPTGKVLELADLAELVGPSVVQVNVTGPKKAGTGSGFVLDKQGTIVTNYHVIEDATAGTIVFSDRTSAPITGYLGVWPEKDIALVKVECPPDKLHPIRLATSAPRQGERVAAFGSPLGLQESMSEGIVSAVRESEELQTIVPIKLNARLIQTTTPISKGNSGGPLVDMKGMVVGVNTMGFLPIGGENINFAVAIAELPPLLLTRSEIASPLPFRDPTVNEVQRIVKRAKNHCDAGDYDSAIADYTEAIRLDPKNADMYIARGWVYGRTRELDSAIADYTKAIRLDPKKADAYFRRGGAYGLKMDHDSAIADYTKAIRLDPKKADAYFLRGGAYGLKMDHDSAIADYTEAIRLDPKNARAYYMRAMDYNGKRDHDSAIADYTEAIRLDPKNASAYYWRGKAYELKGLEAIAKRDFEQATKLGYKPPDTEPLNRNPPENDRKVAEAFPERSKVRDKWKKIVIGMPFPQVEILLGRPNDVRTYGSVGANWTYRFDWTPYQGLVSFDGNGRVDGWSEPLDWNLK